MIKPQFSIRFLLKFTALIAFISFLAVNLQYDTLRGNFVQSQGVYQGIQKNGETVECEFMGGTLDQLRIRFFWKNKYFYKFYITVGKSTPPSHTQKDYEKEGWTRID